MGLLSKIRGRSQHSGTQADTSNVLVPGQKVYLSTFGQVYMGVVVTKDESYDFLTKADKYIVKLDGTNELLSVRRDCITPQGGLDRPEYRLSPITPSR